MYRHRQGLALTNGSGPQMLSSLSATLISLRLYMILQTKLHDDPAAFVTMLHTNWSGEEVTEMKTVHCHDSADHDSVCAVATCVSSDYLLLVHLRTLAVSSSLA